jgi:hypothetical protein
MVMGRFAHRVRGLAVARLLCAANRSRAAIQRAPQIPAAELSYLERGVWDA